MRLGSDEPTIPSWNARSIRESVWPLGGCEPMPPKLIGIATAWDEQERWRTHRDSADRLAYIDHAPVVPGIAERSWLHPWGAPGANLGLRHGGCSTARRRLQRGPLGDAAVVLRLELDSGLRARPERPDPLDRLAPADRGDRPGPVGGHRLGGQPLHLADARLEG